MDIFGRKRIRELEAALQEAHAAHAAAHREADTLAKGLLTFAIRGQWTIDQGRAKEWRWKSATERPFDIARRALGHRWQPGRSE